MNINEIKKATYRQKPDANFVYILNGTAHYYADLDDCRVHYEIPVTDMGEAIFNSRMEAKHLNRWIVNSISKEK